MFPFPNKTALDQVILDGKQATNHYLNPPSPQQKNMKKNDDPVHWCIYAYPSLSDQLLTHYGLLMPYDDMALDHHWLR